MSESPRSDRRNRPARRTARGSGRSTLPASFEPQLAILVPTPPDGDEWVHEIKYDGYRIGCRIEPGRVALISRNNNDWTDRFPEVRDAAARLRVRTAFLDGEVAVVDAQGRTSFQALQNASRGAGRGDLVYFVFDVLHLDGENVAERPLDDRKARLAALLDGGADRGRIRFSEHIDGGGTQVLERACALGVEGIVSKRRDLPYRAGRNDSWRKSKCLRRQEFVIVGFTEPEGRRPGLGALLVAYGEAGDLVFAGKVGTGFSDRVARDLRARLEAIEQATPSLARRPAGWLGRNAHWVKPELVAEVTFTEWTADGKIRHPSFQGLREDKAATAVTRERPTEPGEASAIAPRTLRTTKPITARPDDRTVAMRRPGATSRTANTRRAAAARPTIAGIGISHPDRVVFREPAITKIDLARFFERIGEWIVPHLKGRPLTLVRCPDGAGGACFYMKHSQAYAPPSLRRVRVQEKTKIGEYLIADDVAGVVGLVQMNVLEFHTWNSRIDRVEQPDRLVLDIDPGPEIGWAQVVEAARLVRAVLDALPLRSFVKTTGGRGLHVVAPIVPSADWSECLELAREIAEAIVRSQPALYTTKFAKAGRERKILIDYLRNNRTNTSVAAYSTRARPGAPMSVPLAWDELSSRTPPDRFTVHTIEARLSRLPVDPWAEYFTLRQRIPRSARKALTAM